MNLLILTLVSLAVSATNTFTPTVFWHGMGDNCCSGISNLSATMESWYPGMKTHSIMIGSDEKADEKAGFFDKIARQVEEVCVKLKEIPDLQEGFNAIGFSQGGLFFRAYVQMCNNPPVKNLITFGSPHAGTADIPACDKESVSCSLMRSIVKNGVYWNWIQNSIVQAQYYKTWQNLDRYHKANIFLPDLNQEGPFITLKKEYRERLLSLERLVLVRFMNDTMIKPRDSAWFSFFDESGQIKDIHDQDWYKNDTLGIKSLDASDRIEFLSLPGTHMQIPLEQFKQITDKFLAKTSLLKIVE